MHTPYDVHHGLADAVRDERAFVLAEAYTRHPKRFPGKPLAPPKLPDTAWINKPIPEQQLKPPFRHRVRTNTPTRQN